MTTAIPLRVGRKHTSAQRCVECGVVKSAAREALTNGRKTGWRYTVDQARIKSWRRWLLAGKRIAEAKTNVKEGLACSDAELLQALAAASAFVAAADGSDKAIIRNEFIRFVRRQGFVSESRCGVLGGAFDCALRRLTEAGNAPAILLETLRPLAGLSLASTVVRTAERVAGADRSMRPSRILALVTLRSILMESADGSSVHRGGDVRSRQTALPELRDPRSPRPVP